MDKNNSDKNNDSGKSWFDKIYIWIGIFAGICTIFGTSLPSFVSKIFNKKSELTSTEKQSNLYSVLTKVEGYYQNYEFSYPEETNYENVKKLINYVRLKDDYGKIFAVPTCLYTNKDINNIDSILLTGSDGSSFLYSIHDLILEPPYITPQWTKQDIIQFITEFTNGTMKNIEIKNFSTTNTSFYVKGIDLNNEDMLIYLMVILSNTVYRSIEIKMPNYKNYDDEVAKEYYVECIYRLSDFIGAEEEIQTYNEFYKNYKYNQYG